MVNNLINNHPEKFLILMWILDNVLNINVILDNVYLINWIPNKLIDCNKKNGCVSQGCGGPKNIIFGPKENEEKVHKKFELWPIRTIIWSAELQAVEGLTDSRVHNWPLRHLQHHGKDTTQANT